MGDLDEVFFNNEEFAEPGEYHYASGEIIIIQGIFDNDYTSVDVDTGAPVQGLNPRFAIATSKLPKETKQNDFIIIRGINYRIITRQDDGTGVTDLYLQHNSHRNYPNA